MKKSMNRQPLAVIMIMTVIMFLPVLGHAQSILSKTLVDDDGRLAYCERDAAGRMHFYFEDAAANSRNADEMLALYIDYNQNNTIDLFSPGMSASDQAGLDRVFLISRQKGFCPEYLYSHNSASKCGQFLSLAQFNIEFKTTRNSSEQHFCWEIAVPTKELTLAQNNKAYVTVLFCRAKNDCKIYPEQTGEMFSQVDTIEW
jgi:hypothetical protein